MHGPPPRQAWKTGDTIRVHFPMALRFEQISDPRPQFFGFGTIHYGPIALAGITADDVMLLGNKTLDEVKTVIFTRRVAE